MTLKRRYVVGGVIAILLVALFALSAWATDAEMYFSTDKNGQNRVTDIQEGDSIWIVVYDPDENIDCDVRDKIWTDIKVMDPKTGAYITWISYDDPVAAPAPAAFETALYVPFQGHEPGNAGNLSYDYLEETGADTGLFTSKRAYQVGTRENFAMERTNTHVVDSNAHPDPSGFSGATIPLMDFNFGHYDYRPGVLPAILRGYLDGIAGFQGGAMAWADPAVATWILPAGRAGGVGGPNVDYLIGRFENMDTLTGLYVDQNDAKDVACAMAKIIDTEAICSWDQEIYKDANGSAQLTIIDPDENLDCNRVEWVPVFVIVNPGSWNPVDFVQTPGVGGVSPTTFCALKRTGGVNWVPPPVLTGVWNVAPNLGVPIAWWNIYNSLIPVPAPANITNNQTFMLGAYYIQYPTTIAPANVTTFDTTDPNGVVMCSFYAQETGVNTGEFQLNFNNLAPDLGFNSLDVNDVVVAYYLDPNDEDDFTLCPTYIESRSCHSITSFTNAVRAEKDVFWIGRDPVYVQVIDSNANVDPCCPEQVVVHICDPHEEDDSEWVVLDETSSNSPVFFTNNGYQLLPVWDALGVGIAAVGYQLRLDNWKLEVFNEDDVYARYNDVIYVAGVTGLAGLGDLLSVSTANTAFPPQIRVTRVDNDVSFATMDIASTEVFQFGGTTNMWFLDRQGNRVSGYVNSDCVFIEVLDPDQDEDQYRRERIDGYWDHLNGRVTSGQNFPFGPANQPGAAPFVQPIIFPAAVAPSTINNMLGNQNMFVPGTGGDPTAAFPPGVAGTDEFAKVYVLNPRTGLWAAVDLLETGTATGDFVSVICVDLVSQYVNVPTLGVIPGDTIIAVYQDPSNHSDSAWVCIKVGCGGGGTPPGQASTTKFADASGSVVTQYTDADSVYVKVVDPSHAGAASLLAAVEIDGSNFDLAPLTGATTDTFITAAISMTALGVGAGDSITATYTDPVDPTDSSSDTVSIIASVLDVTGVIAKPNPFDTDTTFAFADGSTGLADTFSVSVYDLAGHAVWTYVATNANEIVWDGTNEAGASLANGPYIFVAVASDGTDTFTYKGTVFIKQ